MVTRMSPAGSARRPDDLIVEEPMTIQLDGERGDHHDAHAGPRLRARRRLVLHRGPARRRAGHRRALLRRRLGDGQRVQRRHRRDRRPGPDPDAPPRHHVVELRLVRQRSARRAGRPARAARRPAAGDRTSTCSVDPRVASSPARACSPRPARCMPRRRSTPTARSGHPRGRRPAQRRRQGRRRAAARRPGAGARDDDRWGCSSAAGRRSRWCRRRGPAGSGRSWR